MPIVADAAAAVRADMSGFNKDLQQGGDKAVKGLGAKLKSVFSPKNLAIAGVAGGVAIAGAITAGLGQAVGALINIEKLNAQTDAVIRSTGGVAKVTRDEIIGLAGEIEKLTGIEAESVQEGQNLLLTFKNIRNEAGEGNDIFNQATQAMVDMSVAMGTDAKSGAIQLGKALNDPIKGIAALSRVGITFTKDQEEMIRTMTEAGDVMGAQKIILKELEDQFGGSAEAFGNTTAGKIAKFQNSVGEMFESIILGAVKVGEHLGGFTSDIGDSFDFLAMDFGDQSEKIKAVAEDYGLTFDELKNRISDRMRETGESFEEATTFIEGEMANASVEVRREAGEMMVGVGDAISAGIESEIKPEIKRLASMPTEALRDEYNNIRNAAYQSMVEYAKGVMAGQNEPQVAFDAAMQLVEDEMTKAEEIANLQGKLTTLAHAQGIAAAEGKVASVNAINATIDLITARLEYLTGRAYSYGSNLANSYAAGIVNNLGVVHDAGRQLAQGVASQARIESEPPDHSSPLYGITKWGGNIVKTIADGIYNDLGMGTGAARALAGSLVPGFDTPRLGMAGVAPQAGGVTNQWILNVDGVPRTVDSKRAAIEELERLGETWG